MEVIIIFDQEEVLLYRSTSTNELKTVKTSLTNLKSAEINSHRKETSMNNCLTLPLPLVYEIPKEKNTNSPSSSGKRRYEDSCLTDYHQKNERRQHEDDEDNTSNEEDDDDKNNQTLRKMIGYLSCIENKTNNRSNISSISRLSLSLCGGGGSSNNNNSNCNCKNNSSNSNISCVNGINSHHLHHSNEEERNSTCDSFGSDTSSSMKKSKTFKDLVLLETTFIMESMDIGSLFL